MQQQAGRQEGRKEGRRPLVSGADGRFCIPRDPFLLLLRDGRHGDGLQVQSYRTRYDWISRGEVQDKHFVGAWWSRGHLGA